MGSEAELEGSLPYKARQPLLGHFRIAGGAPPLAYQIEAM